MLRVLLVSAPNARIRAIEGCTCPASLPWWACKCDATVSTYDAAGHPWASDNGQPTAGFVAYVRKLHPGATLVHLPVACSLGEVSP